MRKSEESNKKGIKWWALMKLLLLFYVYQLQCVPGRYIKFVTVSLQQYE